MGKAKSFRRKSDDEVVSSQSKVEYGEGRPDNENIITSSDNEYSNEPLISQDDILFSAISDLRKAVIFSEVLGKPRALKNYRR